MNGYNWFHVTVAEGVIYIHVLALFVLRFEREHGIIYIEHAALLAQLVNWKIDEPCSQNMSVLVFGSA